MCLATVTETYKPRLATERVAWKVFEAYGRSGDLFFPYYGGRVKRGKWMRAKKTSVFDDNGNQYMSGFHVFASRKSAAEWASIYGQLPLYKKIVRVTVRNVRVKGMHRPDYATEGDIPCLVADEMFVPEPATRKRKPNA